MRCLYINLDAAEGRRRNVEASFAATAPPDWSLIRIAAKGPDAGAAIAGTQSAAAKACWLSHKAALAATLDDAEDVFIVEDDTSFSPQLFAMAGRFLAGAPQMDIIFSDVLITDLTRMLTLAKQRGRLGEAGNYALQDLAQTGFAAASAYLVRGGSKRRLFELLDGVQSLDAPYDAALRDLTHSGQIHAAVAFPFLTTVSADADASSIQPGGLAYRDATFNAFRRLMFVGRDLGVMRAEVDRLHAEHADEGARLIGDIVAAMMSDRFPNV